MATNRETSSAASRKGSQSSGMRGTGGARTGEKDQHYDVIAVLYHTLQGAETTQQYVEDARKAKDDELATFFEETRAEYVARAEQAKRLLAGRLDTGDGGADEDDADDDDMGDADEDE
jgi:hypothetical protein